MSRIKKIEVSGSILFGRSHGKLDQIYIYSKNAQIVVRWLTVF